LRSRSFGSFGAWFYGHLIGNGTDPSQLEFGYFIGAGVMVLSGVVELVLGVPAERRSLEDVASPLSLVRKAAAESLSGLRGSVEVGPQVRTTGTP
jgi:hypothetical protein